MEHADAAVLLCVLLAYLAAVIRRPVVHQYKFKIPVCLSQHRLNALRQIPLHLIHRRHDAEFDVIVHKPLLFPGEFYPTANLVIPFCWLDSCKTTIMKESQFTEIDFAVCAIKVCPNMRNTLRQH